MNKTRLTIMLLLLVGIAGFFLFQIVGSEKNTSQSSRLNRITANADSTDNKENNPNLSPKEPAPLIPLDRAKTNNDTFSVPPFSRIHNIVDASMATLGGEYQGHTDITDTEGNVAEYSLVYAINGKAPESDMETLYEDINEAQIKRKKGETLLSEAHAEDDSEKLKDAARLLVEGSRELTRESEFATIKISATSDMPPILSFQFGLPDWMLYRDAAIETAQHATGEPCVLKGVRSQGLLGVIFVLETSNGQTLYVDPKQENVYTGFQKTVKDASQKDDKARENEERMTRIRSQWEEFIEYGFDPNIFTLNDLTDLSKKGEASEKE